MRQMLNAAKASSETSRMQAALMIHSLAVVIISGERRTFGSEPNNDQESYPCHD